MKHTISIVTASYNYEDYIKETIESVQKQTVTDWEMIIVDDGSKDNSVNVIESYCKKDNRIKLFRHENGQNRGLSETVQLGIKKASGEWLIFLESDDTITPDYIEKKLEIIEKYPEVSIIFNGINMFGEEEAIKEYDFYFNKQKRFLDKIKFPSKIKKAYQKSRMNIIPTFSCVMVKKEAFRDIDFNSPSKKCLDLFLWLQLARENVFYYIEDKLTNWRMHKNSYINSDSASCDMLKLNHKRIEFLYSKWAILRYIALYLTYYRRKLLQIHLDNGRKEIIIFGKKFSFIK